MSGPSRQLLDLLHCCRAGDNKRAATGHRWIQHAEVVVVVVFWLPNASRGYTELRISPVYQGNLLSLQLANRCRPHTLRLAISLLLSLLLSLLVAVSFHRNLQSSTGYIQNVHVAAEIKLVTSMNTRGRKRKNENENQ